jgi:hypothetical protein
VKCRTDENVEQAPLIHNQFGKYSTYRVITVRRTSDNIETPVTFTNETLYTAKLFAVNGSEEWTLLAQSGEAEYLTDAVEDLWEKVMGRAEVKTRKWMT